VLVSQLSTEESPRFVNGLLARVAREKPALLAADAAALSGDTP